MAYGRYAHRTRWRPKTKKILCDLCQLFHSRFNGKATKLDRTVKKAIHNINIYTYRQVLDMVGTIGELAQAAECDINTR